MFTNELAERLIVELVAELKKGARFVDYEDEALFNRAVAQAETLHLMVLGLAFLEYIDPTANEEENNGAGIARAMNNSIWNHNWIQDVYGEG